MFLFEKADQYMYYTCIDAYIKLIFTYILNKPYMFYLDFHEKSDFNNAYNFLINKHPIDITKFKQHKYTNGFTITSFDTCIEHTKCGLCGYTYPGTWYFGGLYYEKNKNPINYNGYIKTYNFFTCNCHKKTSITCFNINDVPFLEIRCWPEPLPTTRVDGSPMHQSHLFLLNNAILFNIKYTSIP